MADILYRYKKQVYFNITNKCCCSCTFCIRNHQDYYGEAKNLWLDREPLAEEILAAIVLWFWRTNDGVENPA